MYLTTQGELLNLPLLQRGFDMATISSLPVCLKQAEKLEGDDIIRKKLLSIQKNDYKALDLAIRELSQFSVNQVYKVYYQVFGV